MAISVAEELRQFEKDMDWISAKYSELANEYPEEYVAVYDCRMVDHGSHLNRLMERLKARYGEIAMRITIQYVSPGKDVVIL